MPYAGYEDEFVRQLKAMGVYDAAAKVIWVKGLDNFDEEIINALRRFNLIKIEPCETTYLRIHQAEGTEKNIREKAKP